MYFIFISFLILPAFLTASEVTTILKFLQLNSPQLILQPDLYTICLINVPKLELQTEPEHSAQIDFILSTSKRIIVNVNISM